MKSLFVAVFILTSLSSGAMADNDLTPDDIQRLSPASVRDEAEKKAEQAAKEKELARINTHVCRQILDSVKKVDFTNYPSVDMYSSNEFRQMGDSFGTKQTGDQLSPRQMGTKSRRKSFGPQYE